MTDPKATPHITAYTISEKLLEMPIVPAYSRRDWMATHGGHAYHCLPLTIASQAGWFLLNPHGFTATWDGGDERESITITYDEPAPADDLIYAISLFRQGIMTFNLPYLFRTSPGYNLWVRGPANWIKDGIQPLEGMVENDWIESTFTMNWKFTRPNVPVRFEKDEPFCMIVPIQRGMIDSFVPQMRPLAADPDLKERFNAWNDLRAATNQKSRYRSALASAFERSEPRTPYDGHYIRGETVRDGVRFPDHQTRLDVKPFHTKWQDKITAFLEKMRLRDQAEENAP